MRGWTAQQAQGLAFMQARIQRTEQRPSSHEIAAHMGVAVQAAYQHVRALARTGVLSTAPRHGGICVSADHMPHAGLPLLGQVATGTPILAAENLEGYKATWRSSGCEVIGRTCACDGSRETA